MNPAPKKDPGGNPTPKNTPVGSQPQKKIPVGTQPQKTPWWEPNPKKDLGGNPTPKNHPGVNPTPNFSISKPPKTRDDEGGGSPARRPVLVGRHDDHLDGDGGAQEVDHLLMILGELSPPKHPG